MSGWDNPHMRANAPIGTLSAPVGTLVLPEHPLNRSIRDPTIFAV
jgi:hypothetical protein